MTTLIFVILIVSRSHAFFLVVPVGSFLHVLVVVAVQHRALLWQSQIKNKTRIPHVPDEEQEALRFGVWSMEFRTGVVLLFAFDLFMIASILANFCGTSSLATE